MCAMACYHTLRSYDYSQINLCEFFLAEVAAYSLRPAQWESNSP